MKAPVVKVLSWLIPAVLAAVVSIAALIQGYWIASASRDLEHRRAVAILKLQIVEAANRLDFASAQLLLDHVLKPIDEPSLFDRFAGEYRKIINARAPETEAGTSREALGDIVPRASIPTFRNLVDRLNGDERLAISNELVELYRSQPQDVVTALIAALLPASDPRSYRVNLYVAFTLARIREGWRGTPAQLRVIEALRSTPSYGRDATFKKRVDEAVGNFRGT